MKLFNLGQVVMTQGIANFIEDSSTRKEQISNLLRLHHSGDWGNIPEEDSEMNDQALFHGDRILSSHMINNEKIWIITEADRSCTTILLPEEY